MNFEAIPREWLLKELTLQECEHQHAIEIEIDDSLSVVPFGYQNDKWNHLKSLMLANDEIWNFDSPQGHWDSLCGRSGVALVRNNKIIYTIISLMN